MGRRWTVSRQGSDPVSRAEWAEGVIQVERVTAKLLRLEIISQDVLSISSGHVHQARDNV